MIELNVWSQILLSKNRESKKAQGRRRYRAQATVAGVFAARRGGLRLWRPAKGASFTPQSDGKLELIKDESRERHRAGNHRYSFPRTNPPPDVMQGLMRTFRSTRGTAEEMATIIAFWRPSESSLSRRGKPTMPMVE
jgi:hypothetical protein